MSIIDCENLKGMSLEDLKVLVDSRVTTEPVKEDLRNLTAFTGVRNLNLFWRILVDPCWGPDLQNVVKKEVSLWGQQDNSERTWTRLMHWTFPMIVEICESGEECDQDDKKGKAVAENCQLGLENCYLKVLDPGLRYQASKMGLGLQGLYLETLPVQVVETVEKYLNNIEDGKDPIDDGGCKKENNIEDDRSKCQFTIIDHELYYVGENIRLETEFTADTEGLHPLFLYPKYSELTGLKRSFHKGMVYAHENNLGPDGKREATWVVSQDTVTCLDSLERKVDSESRGIYFSDPYLLAGQHLLIVSQDQNFGAVPGVVQPYFEFLVDTIPIRTPQTNDAAHLFYTGPQCFYIGFCPGLRLNDLLRIKRIMFDPHSSCYGC